MIWFKLAWRNLWRNKGRTFVQLAVISGSLLFAIFFNNLSTGAYEKLISVAVRAGSGHLVFQNPKYLEQRQINQIISYNEANSLLAKQKHIQFALPRLNIPSLAKSSHGNKSAIMIGVDFEKEKLVNSLLAHKKCISGNLPKGKYINRVYIGAELADRLSVKPGKKIVVMFQNLTGQVTSKLLRISGIFKTGMSQIDGSVIFIDRKNLAKAFGNQDAIHELAIILDDRNNMSEVKANIISRIPINSKLVLLPWQISMKQVADAMRIDHAQFKIMVFMLYFLVGIGTINLLLMSVMERTREFGLLRALGMARINISKMVVYEATLLAVIGIVIGLFLSLFASGYSYYYGIDFTPLVGGPQEVAGMIFQPIVHSIWNIPWMIDLSFGLYFIVVFGSVFPARKALQISPSEAMGKY